MWCRRALVLLAGLAGLLMACRPTPTSRAAPLVHSAYVWKQGWDARAEKGLARDVIPAAITELNVLVGECGLAGGARVVRVPWDAVKASSRRISLSVRAGSKFGKNGSLWGNLEEGFGLLTKGLKAAREAGVRVEGVQVDFDCPTRLLGEYAAQVRKLRPGLGEGVALSITTLPSWLGASDFSTLIGEVDGWTLQLHGTSKPSLSRPTPLFDATQALAWIDQARRLDKPFRVALPSYAYLACFSEKGAFLGMRAEGGGGLPEGTASTQCLPSRPSEVLAVLKALNDGHYDKVLAVDWYRLPLPGDTQVWTAKGLGQVIAGQSLGEALKVELDRQGALTDLTLVNPTEQPLPLTGVRVTWEESAKLVAADGVSDWEAEQLEGGQGGRFRLRAGAGFLAPGARRVIGWIRLTEASEVKAEGER